MRRNRQFFLIVTVGLLLGSCARRLPSDLLPGDAGSTIPGPNSQSGQAADLAVPPQAPGVLGSQTNLNQRAPAATPVPQTPPPATPVATPAPVTPKPAANYPQKPDASWRYATLKTSRGTISLELYPDKAPNTVKNFAQKAQNGFYQGLTFHRVENWVIQGGDPKGNGTGGGSMATELNDVPFEAGSLGVARGGNIEVSNDAQFFICTADCSWLNGQYTNFGKVIDGLDVAQAIEVGDTIESLSVSETE